MRHQRQESYVLGGGMVPRLALLRAHKTILSRMWLLCMALLIPSYSDAAFPAEWQHTAAAALAESQMQLVT